ncbi:unnamed protein product [Nezara viridula]|uniref:Uncharacterized protein n=1 Tax=Nezara viridula TaxID=85310 RepID=A0A9P0EEN5_NEZVI|nr:unnamed protein product [Nezara viridula]
MRITVHLGWRKVGTGLWRKRMNLKLKTTESNMMTDLGGNWASSITIQGQSSEASVCLHDLTQDIASPFTHCYCRISSSASCEGFNYTWIFTEII